MSGVETKVLHDCIGMWLTGCVAFTNIWLIDWDLCKELLFSKDGSISVGVSTSISVSDFYLPCSIILGTTDPETSKRQVHDVNVLMCFWGSWSNDNILKDWWPYWCKVAHCLPLVFVAWLPFTVVRVWFGCGCTFGNQRGGVGAVVDSKVQGRNFDYVDFIYSVLK